MRKHHSLKKFAYMEKNAQVAQEGHVLEESCLFLKEDEHGAQGVMREETRGWLMARDLRERQKELRGTHGRNKP